MLTRRSLTKSGFAGILAVGAFRPASFSAQTPSAGLQYQGTLGTQNLPELPTAPAGECAIVLQAHGGDKAVAVLYHNAADVPMCVNAVTATSSEEFVPEESVHAPHILQPGEYGIACPQFEWSLDEADEVSVQLTVVPAEEADPTLISLPISTIEFSLDGEMQEMRIDLPNRTEHTLAAGNGAIGIFFTPGGEILDWFSSTSMGEFEPGEDKIINASSNSLTVSDSFMIAFGGRAID